MSKDGTAEVLVVFLAWCYGYSCNCFVLGGQPRQVRGTLVECCRWTSLDCGERVWLAAEVFNLTQQGFSLADCLKSASEQGALKRGSNRSRIWKVCVNRGIVHARTIATRGRLPDTQHSAFAATRHSARWKVEFSARPGERGRHCGHRLGAQARAV